MLSGVPVVYGIDPYSEEQYPSFQLGTIGITADGRKFRYAKNGAATTAGYLYQAPAEVGNHQNLTPSAAAVGAMEVTVTLGGSAATANQYADGYLVVTSTAGNGLYYKIKSHPAQSSTSGTLTLKLYDPVKVAITASSTIDLVSSPYNGVIINPTTASSVPIGAAMIAQTSGYYGWFQSGGIGIAVANAAGGVSVGQTVCASNGTAGTIENLAGTQGLIGLAVTAIDANQSGAVMYLLD